MIGLEKEKVKLVSYEIEWELEFLREKEKLLKNIQEDIFKEYLVGIEHVGSTSIGIMSKPIIDVLVVINNYDKISTLILHKLAKMEYDLIAWDMKEEWMFLVKETDELTTHHLHCVQVGNKRHREYILFRDFLRSDKYWARQYEEVKKELSIKYKDDRRAYSVSKNNIINNILQKAQYQNRK